MMFDNENECLSTIKDIREQTDLGVQMDESLRFEKQISNVVQKANGVLASIKRTFKYINIDSFPVLYKSLVRPHLEYCNSIWSPYMVKDIKLMESVQRRATKIVPTLSFLPYEERLKLLDLPTARSKTRMSRISRISRIFFSNFYKSVFSIFTVTWISKIRDFQTSV